MKTLLKLIAVLMCIFSLGLPVHSDEQGKLKGGFRDLAFGAKLTDLQGFSKDGEFGDYLTYERKSDVLKLGDSSLDSIQYEFWSEKLAMVVLKQKSTMLSSASKHIEEFLNSVYGSPNTIKRPEPSSSSKFAQEIWEDDKTTVIYTIFMGSPGNPLGIDVSVVIKSKEIEAERMKAKGQADSTSPNGL